MRGNWGVRRGVVLPGSETGWRSVRAYDLEGYLRPRTVALARSPQVGPDAISGSSDKWLLRGGGG